jgi:hypothetical protein
MIDCSAGLLHPVRRELDGDRAGDGHERHRERYGQYRKAPLLGGCQQVVRYPIM